MKRYMITFYDSEMGRIGRYPYYDYEIGCVSVHEVLNVLQRCGYITHNEEVQMSDCKCVMIEEDQ